MINAISKIMVDILNFLYGFTHDYGFAIVLFAAVVKIALYLPTQQQFQAMKDMAALQPEIKKLQEIHKGDPKQMQTAQMELFKRHKINPLGGCLPILIQLPILWAIWVAIKDMKELAGATFLWINPALSEKLAHVKILGMKLIGANLGEPDIIMLLLYAISMYLSQKITVTDKSAAQSQAALTYMMPILLVFFLRTFPSALILYWLVFNILTIAQQVMIMKQPSRVAISIQNHNALEQPKKAVVKKEKKESVGV